MTHSPECAKSSTSMPSPLVGCTCGADKRQPTIRTIEPNVDEAMIADLETMIALARDGKVVGFAAIFLQNDYTFRHGWSRRVIEEYHALAIGDLEILKYELVKKFLEAHDE